MNKDLKVDVVANDNLDDYCELCTTVAQQMAYPSFFCSGEWLKTAAEAIRPEDTLLLLAVKSGADVKALLPLVTKRNALGGRDLRFLGMDFYPDPLGLICNSAERVDCIQAIKAYLPGLPGWDRLIIDWVLEDEVVAWGTLGKPIAVEPFKPLQQDFLSLIGKLKRNNRRYLKAKVGKIQDAGGELVISRGTATHNAFLEGLHVLHEKRAEQRNLVSSFAGNCVDAFHQRLVKNTDIARFYGIRLDERFVAVFYGFEFCNRFFAYQIAHDPQYGELGPGTAVLYFAIEDCCRRGLTEFNFLQGDESYKGIWTNDSRVLYRCVLNSGTWRSNVLSSLGSGKDLLKDGLARMNSGT